MASMMEKISVQLTMMEQTGPWGPVVRARMAIPIENWQNALPAAPMRKRCGLKGCEGLDEFQ